MPHTATRQEEGREACPSRPVLPLGVDEKEKRRLCGICGGASLRTRLDALYCSRRCASRAWRQRSYPYTFLRCKQCGAEFKRVTSQQVYCSRACGDAWWLALKASRHQRRGVARIGEQRVPRQTCEICQCLFYAAPVRLRRKHGRFCSKLCRGTSEAIRIGADPKLWPRGSHKRARGGRRSDLGDTYYRSSWEANWARYLNWLKAHNEIQDWSYETDTFEFSVKRGSRFYTPDFKVTNLNGSIEYHEIKGYMDQRSQTKIRRMAKYHPQVKLIVIDGKQYQSMAKNLRGLIVGWESAQQAK